MSSRTTTSFVTFVHPFVLGGYSDELPPGSYEVITEHEDLRELSFEAYRRTATHLLVKKSGRSEMRLVEQRNLDFALAQDKACSDRLNNSEAALSPPGDQK